MVYGLRACGAGEAGRRIRRAWLALGLRFRLTNRRREVQGVEAGRQTAAGLTPRRPAAGLGGLRAPGVTRQFCLPGGFQKGAAVPGQAGRGVQGGGACRGRAGARAASSRSDGCRGRAAATAAARPRGRAAYCGGSQLAAPGRLALTLRPPCLAESSSSAAPSAVLADVSCSCGAPISSRSIAQRGFEGEGGPQRGQGMLRGPPLPGAARCGPVLFTNDSSVGCRRRPGLLSAPALRTVGVRFIAGSVRNRG